MAKSKSNYRYARFQKVDVEQSSIYEYSYDNGLKCKIYVVCSSYITNAPNEYATGER